MNAMSTTQLKILKLFRTIIIFNIIAIIILFSISKIPTEKEDKESQVKFRTATSGITWNCADKDGKVIAMMAYGQSVKITHKKFPARKKNECSYAYPDNFRVNNTPYSSKVYGFPKNKLPKSTREYMNSIPFPQFKPWTIVLVLTNNPDNPQNNYIKAAAFQYEGQSFSFENKTSKDKPLYVVAMFNYPDTMFNEQIGYGGYTITLGVKQST